MPLLWCSVRSIVGLTLVAVLITSPSLARAAEQEDVESGRDVFVANCAMCHGSDASGMMGMHPSLRGAVDRLTAEGVEVTIRNGRDTDPPMPAFGDRLRDEQIADLVAYIGSLPPGPRNFGPGGDGGGMMGDGMMGDGMMGGGMWLWPLVGFGLLVAIGIAIAIAVRRPGGRSTSRDVLDRRYAEGQISRDEYLRARRDLEDGPQ